MNKDLEIIKKKYGENMAKLCRRLFPTILETEGALPELLLNSFEPTRCLYEDIANNDLNGTFKDFIFSQFTTEEKVYQDIEETPEELMEKAGYKLIKCETDEDVKSFMKYYKENELLCTFRDDKRIDTHIIFFAVKNNVDEIKREDFDTPRRQDEYGTSVISIQFAKGETNTLSIKNRYNHSVLGCDATFSNDLDNIYPGLTDSFKKYYNINLVAKEQCYNFPGYINTITNKRFKYNQEVDNSYYCENNVVINQGNAIQYDKSRYEVLDYFILDKVNKTITCPIKDGFTEDFKNVKKIDIKNNKKDETRTFKITKEDGTWFKFDVDKRNRIISYTNYFKTHLENNFLFRNLTLKEINTPNVRTIGERCLFYCKNIKKLNFPILETMGEDAFHDIKELEELHAPYLKEMGDYCFYSLSRMKKFDLPSLEKMGEYCFIHEQSLTELNLPNLKTMGAHSFYSNLNLTKFNAPKLIKMGDACLIKNVSLKEFYVPSLEVMGCNVLQDNLGLEELDASNLRKMGLCCFYNNENIKKLVLPKLEHMGARCFWNNKKLTKLNLPSLKTMDKDCFKENQIISDVNAESLETVEKGFLVNNINLEKLSLPSLRSADVDFLKNNEKLMVLDVPKLRSVGYNCLVYNKNLKILNAPNLEYIGINGFNSLKDIKDFNAPLLTNVENCFKSSKKINKQIRKNLENFNKNNKIEEELVK